MKIVILSTLVASLFASTVLGTGVVNGSFESPDLGGTVSLNFSQSTRPAGFTWGVIGDIDLIGPDFAVASDGPQFIDVNGWNPGGIYQDITFNESGAWELVFDMSANPDRLGSKGFQIDFGPTNGALSSLGIYGLDSAGRTWSNLQWETITVTLPHVDAGTTYRLQFTTTNTGASGALLDRVHMQSTGPNCLSNLVGVAGWWPAEGDAAEIVNGFHGAPTEEVGFVPGKVGQAFSLNGSNAFVSVPDNELLRPTNSVTAEAWVWLNEPRSVAPIIKKAGGNGSWLSGYALEMDDFGGSHVRFWVYLSGIGWVRSAQTTLPLQEWTHVAGSYDGTNILLYINGEARGTPTVRPGVIVPAVNDLQIGHDPHFTDRYFPGLIDEPTVWRRALALEEIAAIYEAGSAGKCEPGPPEPPCMPPDGMVSWWQGESDFLDSIGDNDGVSIGDVGFMEGMVGQAFAFNGTTGCVQVAASPSLDVGKGEGLTVECWINPQIATGSQPVVEWNRSDQGSAYGAHLWASIPNRPAGVLFANLLDSNGDWRIIEAPAGTIKTNQLQHIAVSYDRASGLGRLYHNGEVVGEEDLGSFEARTDRDLFIGCRPNGNFHSAVFKGLIDEVSLYNRALSTEDIAAIYQAGSAGKCEPQPQPDCVTPPTGLVNWWRGEGNHSDVLGEVNGSPTDISNFVSGVVGQAFNFNGVNSEIRFGNTVGNFGTNDFSIEFWVRTTSTDPFVQIMEKRLFCGATSEFCIRLGGLAGVGRLNVEIQGGPVSGFALYGSQALNDGVFHHVAIVREGTNHFVYVDGTLDASKSASAVSMVNNTADFRVGNGVCVGTDGTTRFDGDIDELSFYHTALSEEVITAIYQAGSAGKCEPEPAPPFIVNQPQDQSVPVGGTATFNVGAVGAQPLAYQWFKESSALENATNSALNLQNVQLADAGEYSVVVTNQLGSATSSNAVLTVTMPPANISIVSTSAPGGGPVSIPVRLRANGNENALGFSISHPVSPNLFPISFIGVTRGDGASDAVLIVSTNQAAAGRIGVAISMPADEKFTAETLEIVHLHFWAELVPVNRMVPFSFTDSPTFRQVADVEANTLPATYSSGMLTLLPADLESDVTPRPTGDRSVTITDWVQAGRFAARLDTPAAGGEFQRADSAPRSTRGDGQIKVTDWVQAGRNVVGMDPLLAVGGPTEPVPSSGGSGDRVRIASAGRAIRIVPLNGAIQNEISTLAALLESEGDENALGFSLVFDPSTFSFAGASLGDDAAEAKMNVNATEAPSGRIGIVLALPAGNSFAPGSREVLKIEMQTADADGEHSLAFDDFPVLRSVSDPNAEELGASYLNSTITINPLPKLSVNYSGTNVILSWPDWAGDFTLQVSSDLTDGWSNAAQLPETNGNSLHISLPIKEDQQLFRLRGP